MGWLKVVVVAVMAAMVSLPVHAQTPADSAAAAGAGRGQQDRMREGRPEQFVPDTLPDSHVPGPARQRSLSVIKDQRARAALQRNPLGVMTMEQFRILFPKGLPQGVEVVKRNIGGRDLVRIVLPKIGVEPPGRQEKQGRRRPASGQRPAQAGGGAGK